jgi:hypothetical protein
MNLSLDGLETFYRKTGFNELGNSKAARAYMYEKFKETREKRNQSWAYAWFYSLLNANGYAVVPAKNLVQNTGVGDALATNTNKSSDHAKVAASAMAFPLIHPTIVQHDRQKDTQLFYLSQKSPWRLFLWTLLKKTGLR